MSDTEPTGGAAESRSPEQLYEAALARFRAGELDEAAPIYEALLEQRPDHFHALHQLGTVRGRQGQLDKALALLRRATEIDPLSPEAHNNLGTVLSLSGHADDAVGHFAIALSVRPDYVSALYNLGTTLQELDRPTEAVERFEAALALAPGRAEILNNLGDALAALDRHAEAIASYERALAVQPNHADARYNLAHSLHELGRLDEAIAAYRQVLALAPGHQRAQSNLLLALNYHHETTPEQLLAEHLAWARAAIPPSGQRLFANSLDPERRLRIGYVSGDFRRHSVAAFLEPLLGAHDHTAFEVHCYSTVATEDEATRRFKSLADRWTPIAGMGAEAAAETIRAEAVDILLDLSGHTNEGRLGVFALRPAPVQISWLGYPSTTGLEAIGFRVTDAVADPPGAADRHHSERLLRLPGCFLCYGPPAAAPAIEPLPMRSAGRITFGSFNALAKLTPPVIRLWAEILDALPAAHLLVKARPLGDPAAAEALRRSFAEAGVESGRVEIVGWQESDASHLALYHRVDIALDSFPYNGTTTTCEALWMGAPVVTLRGNRHAGRVGASLMTALGLPELVAETPSDYVAAAVRLAGDPGRLAALRGSLRQQMAASPLCDGAGFARDFEATLRGVWRSWCGTARGSGNP